jgi:hypothetical protein
LKCSSTPRARPNASASACLVREIEVHGGVKNWFIDVREPMRCRVELGYLSTSGRFHSLVRSNAVSVPPATQADTLDGLRANAREAVSCHYEPGQRPEAIRLRIVREEVLPADE